MCSLKKSWGEPCCFLLQHPHIANPRLQLEHPESGVQRVFDAPCDELTAAHLRCCWAVANHDFMEAYGCQTVVVQVSPNCDFMHALEKCGF